jgi:putative hemolysin
MKKMVLKQKLIDINKLARQAIPELYSALPGKVRDLLFRFLERFLRIRDINDVMHKFRHFQDIDFIEAFFADIDFTVMVKKRELMNIPAQGPFVGIANHPLGGLDGLALLKVIHEVRDDVKIIVNDILMNVDNLKGVFVPYNRKKNHIPVSTVREVSETLKNNGCVLFFPAGGVSRIRPDGLKDPKWMSGAFFFAKRFRCPIVPMFIHAKNSFFYYIFTLIHRKLAALMLPREIFKKKSTSISITIGQIIPADLFKNIPESKLARTLKKAVYALGRGEKTDIQALLQG